MTAINSTFVTDPFAQKASKGMRVQGVYELAPGARLYRFVQRGDLRREELLSSPWWFQGDAVRQVLLAARDGHRGDSTVPGQAAKMAGLSSSWEGSGANYLLAARVIGPLSVFWGNPRSIGIAAPGDTPTGLTGGQATEIEMVPDPRCVQFYAPGMWEEAVFRKTAAVVSYTKFAHSEDLARGDVEVFLSKVSGP
jgi:hypothetical protein